MATLKDARTALDKMLRYGSDNFDDTERDIAIRWALIQIVRESGILRTLGSITVAENDRIITHGLERFLPGRRFAAAYTDADDGFRRVTARDFAEIQGLLDESEATGRPEMINFFSNTQCIIYPISDGDYTIKVPYEQTAPDWTLGTASPADVDLAIPDDYVYGGMLWGAKHLMLDGVDNARREAAGALEKFNAFLEEHVNADIDLAPTTQPDPALYDQTYTPRPAGGP